MTEEGIKRARGRPRKDPDELRPRVKARIGWCDCCNRPIGSLTQAAREIGMPQPTLDKWLKGTRPRPAPHVERIQSWLRGKR